MKNKKHCLWMTGYGPWIKSKIFRVVLVLVVLISCLSGKGFAVTGLDLARQVYDRDDGDDAFFKTEMILIDKNSNKRRRVLETFSKDYDGLIKTHMVFLLPKDIEGTKFLSWENRDEDDTQYLFLPELGRSRRIVSNQKKLRFVNSDFTYEDMQRRKPEDDHHRILEHGLLKGHAVFVLESVPNADNSQYGKRISIIDEQSLVPVAVDFFDKKGRKVKEFRVLSLEQIEGIWTGLRIQMSDLKAKHVTQMNILEVHYNQGVDDRVFEIRNLEQE